MKNIIITGGAGFIGSNFIKKFSKCNYNIINIDCLTYASNLSYLDDLSNNKKYIFFKINILDEYNIKKILTKFNPHFIFNFAAESHVDNSIKDSFKFLETNILGTHSLLKVILDIKSKLDKNFKFIQISTDEVFGDVSKNKRKSLESDPYVTSSPYSASKASADHLVTAWGRTYKIPYNITYSCNNFGPNQNKEKFIPVIINNIISRKKIPLYGDGHQIRDWIYVEDNVEAIMRVALKGKLNEKYNIGTSNTFSNIYLVNMICEIMIKKFNFNKNIFELIKFVKDRPGHDIKYNINSNKIKKIGWTAKNNIYKGLEKTIGWYLNKNG